MSTSYRLNKNVSVDRLLRAVSKAELKVHTPNKQEVKPNEICITCGDNYIWFYVNEDKTVSEVCRYGNNYDAEQTVLEPICEQLKIGYLSEYDEGYFDDEDMGEEDYE